MQRLSLAHGAGPSVPLLSLSRQLLAGYSEEEDYIVRELMNIFEIFSPVAAAAGGRVHDDEVGTSTFSSEKGP